MAIIVVIVSLTPMVLVSGTILYQFNIFSNEMVHAHLAELVQKHRQNIDYFLRQRLNDISHLSRSFDLAQLQNEAFLHQRLRVLQEEYRFVFVDLGLIDENGQQVSYAGPFDLHRADYSNAEWFQRAIRSHRYISNVFLGLRGHPHFIVAAKPQWGGAEWLLRATIDFAAFNSLVENLSVGKTGTAFILNREGEFQTRPPKGELKLTKQQYLNLFQKGDQALLSMPPSNSLEFLLEKLLVEYLVFACSANVQNVHRCAVCDRMVHLVNINERPESLMGFLFMPFREQGCSGKSNLYRIGKADKEIVAHIAALGAVGFVDENQISFAFINCLEFFETGDNTTINKGLSRHTILSQEFVYHHHIKV